MNTKDILSIASNHINQFVGHKFDVLDIKKPVSPEAAVNLAKVVSKLSPILGNLIEFNIVEILNAQEEFHPYGKWKRQDPGFPDAIFEGSILPIPGFEIKTWFPLATEITARFKDSQNHFLEEQTNVCLLSWLPEYVIFGKPIILDVCIVSGRSVALARDQHYHRPPDYIILEPEDTSKRSVNLQQTNTNGYKWQGLDSLREEAEQMILGWGPEAKFYSCSLEYQTKMRELLAKYSYRLDTNFAKIDRIQHEKIEEFKSRVLNITYKGLTIKKWARLIGSKDEVYVANQLREILGITPEVNIDLLLE